MKNLSITLPVIVLSQFCCTSLWFASNGVMQDLISNFNLYETALGHLTSAVQFGFITGTLLFAILTIADRFAPSKVFLFSALLAASFNLAMNWQGNTLTSLLVFRFLTGFFLAGIYPVGMKIATDYYKEGLGRSLGFLVGALVIGTALPHFLNSISQLFYWKSVLYTTSGLAVFGGVLMFVLVPNGPYRKPGLGVDLSAFFRVFKNANFRAAAFGYFGHMWELYAFWAFTPLILKTYTVLHPEASFNLPLWSFLIIGIGGLACIAAGYLSQRLGAKRTAFTALLISCICCLLSPFIFTLANEAMFLGFLLIWGAAVVADSPLFSTLVANNTSPELKGTALTIVNCIGFAISIISIQLLNSLTAFSHSTSMYALLAIGPVLGLIAMARGKND